MRTSKTSSSFLGRIRLSPTGRENLSTYLFLSPAVIGLFIFLIIPFIYSIVISFTSWQILKPPEFVGIDNFIKIFTNDRWAKNSFNVTLYFVGVSIPLKLLVALGLASLLNVEIRGQGAFRLMYYLPAMVMGVPLTILWRWVYDKEGLLNLALALIGIDGPAWRFDKAWVMPSVIIMDLWTVGVMVIIFLAGLKSIPKEMYESASIDGAGAFRKYWSITLPFLSPIILYNSFLAIIRALQLFDYVFVLTGGGPLRKSELWAIFIYRTAFVSREMGYASALSWVLFAAIIITTLLMFRSTKRWVFYMSGG